MHSRTSSACPRMSSASSRYGRALGLGPGSREQGDRITYIEKDASGWAAGKLNGKVGWFPVSFVEPMAPPAAPAALPPPPSLPAPVAPKPTLELKPAAAVAPAKSPLDYRKPSGSVVTPVAKPAPAAPRAATVSVANHTPLALGPPQVAPPPIPKDAGPIHRTLPLPPPPHHTRASYCAPHTQCLQLSPIARQSSCLRIRPTG